MKLVEAVGSRGLLSLEVFINLAMDLALVEGWPGFIDGWINS
jgi:hypothetical protein